MIAILSSAAANLLPTTYMRVERTLDSIPSPSLPETFDGFRFGKSSLMIEKMGNICSHLFIRYEKKVEFLTPIKNGYKKSTIE